jgi:hypothetical protein
MINAPDRGRLPWIRARRIAHGDVMAAGSRQKHVRYEDIRNPNSPGLQRKAPANTAPMVAEEGDDRLKIISNRHWRTGAAPDIESRRKRGGLDFQVGMNPPEIIAGSMARQTRC